ncbi:MAG: helix-turn-helix transcriptional regulator [Acidimicrobiales bacterium]
MTSPAAEELLLKGEHHARTALASLAAATRRRGATSTRVLGDGEVVVLHAEPAKGLAGAAAVVVERPRPIELAPLIVESLGLTDRQRQVAEGLLAGASRAVIARRLGITEHTVAETASAVFRRAGVASRSELCALLFADYYAEPFHAGAAPSPFGYFLPAVGHARLRS